MSADARPVEPASTGQPAVRAAAGPANRRDVAAP